MAYKVKLEKGRRGDGFERAVALTYAGPVVGGQPTRIPMPPAAVAQVQAAYTVMRAQFKVDATDEAALIELTSAAGDLRIEAAYPLPDGTTGPALVFRFTPLHTAKVIDTCVWDLEFSSPGQSPQTWAQGTWSIEQDVTR
ncbi:hypothetical protein [Deinococcus sp. QL22]|uniref:hypothetical protein n=1 Tax=Deinococcus sp. QL22 TaxID=2939437 RepID=UPI0020181678|nr:hypothetical protein [Deinococcus sp. QL22]UQN10345.1 hypothetical protein M1R55_29785 [Deinococcus sp. QL22]UQN10479.1 hypothetical protein M1R55_29110 [Deinococcus sp. QL22]